MPRGNNQKMKMFYLVKILREETDDQHYLTMQEDHFLYTESFPIATPSNTAFPSYMTI